MLLNNHYSMALFQSKPNKGFLGHCLFLHLYYKRIFNSPVEDFYIVSIERNWNSYLSTYVLF